MSGIPNSPRKDWEIRHKLAARCRRCEDLGRPHGSLLPTHYLNPVALAETPVTLVAARTALPPLHRAVGGPYATSEGASRATACCRGRAAPGRPWLAAHDDLETMHLLAERVSSRRAVVFGGCCLPGVAPKLGYAGDVVQQATPTAAHQDGKS